MFLRAASATLAAIAVTLAVPAWAVPTTDRYRTTLEPELARIVRVEKMPGLAIGVIEGDELVYARGFGVMKIGGDARPVTPKTLFHMASITKVFVATACLQLTERHRLELDASAVRYLPYFEVGDSRAPAITLRHLLTHTSGLPDVEDYGWDKPEYDDAALERYVRSLGTTKLLWSPGTQFRYSNIAFEVLGDVIAKSSGVSFESYVQRNIFLPLGMSATTLLLKEANQEALATGHVAQKNGALVPVRHYPYHRAHTPSSNLISNIEDMARWISANLNRGTLGQTRILAEATYEEMWRPLVKVNEKSSVGLAWWTREVLGETAVFHAGGDDGFRSYLVMIPAKKIGVIFVTNGENLPRVSIETAALSVALGRELNPKRAGK